MARTETDRGRAGELPGGDGAGIESAAVDVSGPASSAGISLPDVSGGDSGGQAVTPPLGPGDDDPRYPAAARGVDTTHPLGPGDDDPRHPATTNKQALRSA